MRFWFPWKTRNELLRESIVARIVADARRWKNHQDRCPIVGEPGFTTEGAHRWSVNNALIVNRIVHTCWQLATVTPEGGEIKNGIPD